MERDENQLSGWRHKMHEIIFEADTPAGKFFDVVLLWAIVLSVITVMLESVREYRMEYGTYFRYVEWFFTILFSIEYISRIISTGRPWKYILSFYGIIDLLSVIPTYLSLILTGGQYLVVLRTIRLLRVFRVLKLARYVSGARVITRALIASRHKITVFLGAVIAISTIIGTFMYLIEGPENGFKSIPVSIYWAIVTLTTVGFGDLTPLTTLGKLLASALMILGYSIIAVPTGIVSSEMTKLDKGDLNTTACPQCLYQGHDANAKFCKKCGAELNPEYTD